jgi:flagellar biogenesis protein FliO
MFTLILLVALVIAGIYLQKKFHPSIKEEKGTWYLHYTQGTGTRNKTKLF